MSEWRGLPPRTGCHRLNWQTAIDPTGRAALNVIHYRIILNPESPETLSTSERLPDFRIEKDAVIINDITRSAVISSASGEAAGVIACCSGQRCCASLRLTVHLAYRTPCPSPHCTPSHAASVISLPRSHCPSLALPDRCSA